MESSIFKNTPILFSYFLKLFYVFVTGHQLYFKTEVQLIYIRIFVLGVQHSDSIFLWNVLYLKLSENNGFISLCCKPYCQFSCSVVSSSLRPHELQHTRPPCPAYIFYRQQCVSLIPLLLSCRSHLSLCTSNHQVSLSVSVSWINSFASYIRFHI